MLKEKFKEKVLKIVKRIKKGNFLTYKEVAKLAGNEKAWRVVGNILSKNKDSKIPCHRVIRSDLTVGGYQGSFKNAFKKVGLLLKEGAVGVILTDTVYGICANAFNKEAVNKLFKLKRRKGKPSILLIPSLKELKKFGIKLKNWQKKIIEKLPPKTSFLLSCKSKKFEYLHFQTGGLAFRIPKSKNLLKILEISGPLVASSANLTNFPVARSISEAKKYFKNKVFYFGERKGGKNPSTLIDLRKRKIKILRGNIKLKI